MKDINVFLLFKRDNSGDLFRDMLRFHRINICGKCNDIVSAIPIITTAKIKPDIVIMDANWRISESVIAGLLQQLMSIPQLKIIAVTTHFNLRTLEVYKSLGVHGYFYRNSNAETILRCIKIVAAGNYYFAGQQQDVDYDK